MTRAGANNQLGSLGEETAAEFLVKKGYKLLGTNIVARFGEIDLLMQDGDVIVLVEVKTVSRSGAIDPVYRLDFRKRRVLSLLARMMEARYQQQNIRVDAVTLYWNEGSKPTITHYKNII